MLASVATTRGGLPSTYVAPPPTRQELGAAGWLVLHKIAAMWEQEPSPAQQEDMRTFWRLWGQYYPCPECAEHFRDMLETSPPVVTSNQAMGQWLCERHNEVNVRLGKPEFPCGALESRWGGCGCSEGTPADPTA